MRKLGTASAERRVQPLDTIAITYMVVIARVQAASGDRSTSASMAAFTPASPDVCRTPYSRMSVSCEKIVLRNRLKRAICVGGSTPYAGAVRRAVQGQAKAT